MEWQYNCRSKDCQGNYMFGLCVIFSEPVPRMLADQLRRLLSVVGGGSSSNGGRCCAEVVVIGGLRSYGEMDTSGIRSQVTGHRSQVTGHRSQVTGHRSQFAGQRHQQEAAGGWIERSGLRAIVGALIIHLAAAIAVAAVYV